MSFSNVKPMSCAKLLKWFIWNFTLHVAHESGLHITHKLFWYWYFTQFNHKNHVLSAIQWLCKLLFAIVSKYTIQPIGLWWWFANNTLRSLHSCNCVYILSNNYIRIMIVNITYTSCPFRRTRQNWYCTTYSCGKTYCYNNKITSL